MKKSMVFLGCCITPLLLSAQLTSLSGVASWAYQLQNISPGQIAADTSFELVVIDYSSDGTEAGKFSDIEVSQIKNSGKYALAYISIGEAEDYRYYWQPAWTSNPPAWLGPENPDWAGNYKVRFWDPQWQSLIFSYVDTIMVQGFDGIYMDIIDAWYYWTDENPEEPLADSLMIRFIAKLRAHVDSASGGSGFIMLPQNGEDVLDGNNMDATMRNLLFSSVNAIGVEDVFFPGNLDEDNPYNPDTYRDSLLMEFLSQGKPVFSIEYLTDQAKILQYLNAAAGKSFIPYYCVRNLDQLCSTFVTHIPRGSAASDEPLQFVEVFDLSGRIVFHCEGVDCPVVHFRTGQSRLSHLPPGLYLERTKTKSGFKTVRVAVAP